MRATPRKLAPSSAQLIRSLHSVIHPPRSRAGCLHRGRPVGSKITKASWPGRNHSATSGARDAILLLNVQLLRCMIAEFETDV